MTIRKHLTPALIGAVLGLGGALGFSGAAPGQRLEALEGRVGRLEEDVSLLQGLARMECLDDRQRAVLAGLPCGTLLSGEP